MVKDKIRHAGGANIEVGVIEYDILHVPLVQLAVDLGPGTLEA